MIAPLQTKLVHSHNLLERQEKLVTLGTLAAGIAHEIRNPLTSLKARRSTLEKHLQTGPAARKETDIIGAEISRLERIVQDVLSFARPSDPKLETIAADTLLRDVQGLPRASLNGMAARSSIKPGPATARPSALCCHAKSMILPGMGIATQPARQPVFKPKLDFLQAGRTTRRISLKFVSPP